MDEQLQQTLQEQLRDVHLPDAVGWWPLSAAWWFVVVISVTALAYSSHRLIQRRQKNHYRKVAVRELQAYYTSWRSTHHTSDYLQNANTLLKRCVISFRPEAAKLSGKAWVATLLQHSDTTLSTQTQITLAESVYQVLSTTADEIDVTAINQELTAWIKQHKHEAVGQKRPEAIGKKRPEAPDV